MILDVPTVCKVLGQMFRPTGKPFTRRAVEKWRRDGMPHFKVGREVCFDQETTVQWAKKRFER
jgi:hypothetical protein